MITKDLGMVTAYAYAVSKGYTGTETQFAELMASYATVGQQAVDAALAAARSAQSAQDAQTAAEGARNTAQTTVAGAIAGIQAEGQTQIGAVQAEGQTQVDNVGAAGATQIAAVEAKGRETRESIPDDYTSLANTVNSLSDEIATIDSAVNGETISIPFVQTGDGVIYQSNGLPVTNYTSGGTGNSQLMVINDLSAYGLSAGDKIVATLAYVNSTSFYGIGFHTSAINGGTQVLTSAIEFNALETVQELSAVIPDGTVAIIFYNRLPLNANPTIYKKVDGFINTVNGKLGRIEDDLDGVQTELSEKIDKLGTELGDGVYSVGNVFVNKCGLYASNNGAFNLLSLEHNNVTFKSVGDDIAPICLAGADYVGANHGYYFGYECTSTSHGLTVNDIGKTYNDGTNTWVLIKVIDANKFQMICYDDSKWYKAKTATVPSSVNFGAEKQITDSAQVQIYPSIKSLNIDVAENTDELFRVIEQYDIIDLGTAIDALIGNVGNNSNESLVELADVVINQSTVWDFDKYGNAVIYQQIEKKKAISISNYSGSQCMDFANTDMFAVLGTTFDTLQTAEENASKDKWRNPDVAPSVFIKSNADKSKGFVIAYLVDRTNDIYSTAGYVQNSTKKMYPNMIQPTGTEIKTYGNIILRLPLIRQNTGADYVAYTTVGNDIYMFIGVLSAKTVDIVADAAIFGKSITVIESSNITVNTQRVITSLNITSTGEGYCLLKIS